MVPPYRVPANWSPQRAGRGVDALGIVLVVLFAVPTWSFAHRIP